MSVRDRDARLHQLRERRVQVQGGDRVGGARGVGGPARGEAVERGPQVGLGDGLLADRHAPSVGRSLQHPRDPEPLGQFVHHVVAGQDELGAPLDHRVAERHRPHAAPDPVARLEHGHLGSAGAQGVGGAEAGVARADDDDPLHSPLRSIGRDIARMHD